ncbi:MAG: iron ABC transporter permease [Deltaproteobacteria bacterium]|nr:iron ABC transporter permease [Deltaproteobacteria bacterium]
MMENYRKNILTPSRVITLSLIMLGVLALVTAASLALGTADVSLKDILEILTGTAPKDDPARLIILRIRLPRILLAGLVGFALSVGGVVFQAILRNPLADPFILGVSSGSAFGAVIAIALGLGFSLGVPVLSFAGALFTIYLVMAIGSRKIGMESSTILLTGVIINAFFTAIIMSFISVSSDDRLHTMLFWLYGDLSQGKYGQLLIIAPFIIVSSIILFAFSRDLNIITTGEENAAQLGVEVEWVKKVSLVIVSLIMGLVVAFSGLIGFVGLIVPHLARMAFGSDHRVLIPAASIGGAIFLIAADTLARTIISPSELPVGVITAFMGAPFFIILLKKRGSQWIRS